MKKSKLKISVNSGFALNRFTNNDEFIRFVKNYLKIDHIQLTSDFLMLNLENKLIKKNLFDLEKALIKYNININSTLTGGFTRLNHLAHPNKSIQNFWIKWFKNFFKISKFLGANYSGSHLGILSYKEDKNSTKILQNRLLKNWHILSEYAYKINLKGIIWEPMSITREFGETIKKTKKIDQLLNKNSKCPFFLCLDVGHGDISSKNPDNYNPYKWLEEFNKKSPVIHLKQVIKNNFNHLSFTNENNLNGLIKKENVLSFFDKKDIENIEFALELSFKERDPIDRNLKRDVKESVLYWKN